MTTQPAKKNYVAIGPAPYGLIIYRTDTPQFQDFVARLGRQPGRTRNPLGRFRSARAGGQNEGF